MTTINHTFRQFGREITLTLFADDHVTNTIVSSDDFYERVMLDDILRRTSPGDLAVDVGAYVGTHTVFMAAIAGLKVISLEPFPESRALLEKNVAQNGLEAQVEIHGVGAGADKGTASIDMVDEANLGMVRLEPGAGPIAVKTLDEIAEGREVKVLKIDVEGMEYDVLKGATEILESARPLIYVEVVDAARERGVRNLLTPLDYRFAREFNRTPSQLYVPADHLASSLYPTWLSDQASDHAYALRDAMRTTESLLDVSRQQAREMREYREQLKRTTSLFNELYSRTQAATRSNNEVLARMDSLQQQLDEILERLGGEPPGDEEE